MTLFTPWLERFDPPSHPDVGSFVRGVVVAAVLSVVAWAAVIVVLVWVL